MNHPSASHIYNKSASLVAAARAAAHINAQLVAEGKIHPSDRNPSLLIGSVRKEKKAKSGRKDLFHAEIEINDLPQKIRNLLTKGYIQEQIQWKSKAALCTKGKYTPPQEKNIHNDEKPLYICVQAIDRSAVDDAVLEIKKFIKEHTASGSGSSLEDSLSKSGTENFQVTLQPHSVLIKDKVYTNLDHAPPTFKLIERVLGTSGDNIAYIQNETGVSVTVQGQGYTAGIVDEPLHLLLEHVDPGAVQNARVLALSLVGTLQQDYILWQREQNMIQQQHFVYTLSHPYFQGSSLGNASCQYPTLAMVYGGGNHLGQTAASTELHSEQQDLSAKRPSRFDLQQITGLNATTGGDSLAKRPKLANPSNT